jgi:uncharacterized protein YjaZ
MSITDIDGLEEEIESLRNLGTGEIVVKALEQASALIEGPHTIVCITALEPESTFFSENMNGVSGRTLGSGKIWIKASLQADWEDQVPYTIAHEYHHSVWTSRHYENGLGNDLLSYLVFEGKADSFTGLVDPEFSAPWVNALSPDQEAEQWRKMKSQLTITDYGMQRRYMYGDERSIPRWIGYTIGNHIVQSYLRQNPETTLDDWTAMDAWEIHEQSRYSGEP